MDYTQTKTLMLPVGGLRPNTGQMEAIGVHANPRQISESDYQKLLKSMRDKNMTGLLPLKVYQYNDEWIVLGGNMRLRAMQELGIESVSCIVVPDGTDAETLNEFIIKDNSTYGEWDMDALANWDEPLDDWGVDVPKFEEPKNKGEIDTEGFEDKVKIELSFTQDEFAFINGRLLEIADTKEKALLQVLGYGA